MNEVAARAAPAAEDENPDHHEIYEQRSSLADGGRFRLLDPKDFVKQHW